MKTFVLSNKQSVAESLAYLGAQNRGFSLLLAEIIHEIANVRLRVAMATSLLYPVL